MTISKKLINIIAFALWAPFIAQAYDTNKLMGEIQTITTFAQSLHQSNSTKAQNIAFWLDKKLMDQYGTTDEDIIALSNIINNPVFDNESKITIFAGTMQREAQQARNNKISRIAEAICMTLVSVGVIGLTVWAIIEDIKNPRPIMYVKPEPRVVSVIFETTRRTPVVCVSPSFSYFTTSYQVWP